MTIRNAEQIVQHVTRIAQIATKFYALFGSDYRMSENSPARAWDLYREFMNEQALIASLLDSRALDKPFIRYEKWWERRDVINTGLVNEMASETLRLVEHAAYLEAIGEKPDDSISLLGIQESLAGMLHPATRRQDVNREEATDSDELPEAV
jgi:hypothetical protein